MTIHPIIPIWLMSIICIILLVLKRKGVWPYIRQILIVILLFIINLRPMIPGETVELGEQEMNVSVLFVVDETISMAAEDYNGTNPRLDGVKETCAHIIDELPGARFAVIGFHNSAVDLSPYTDNSSHVRSVINSITPIIRLYAQGTNLDVPLEMMEINLKNVTEKKNVMTVVFYISDGEMNSEEKRESFAAIEKYVDKGAVLGFGTTEGGQMHAKPYYGGTVELVEDNSSYPTKPAISKINETNLNAIASELKVPYVHVKSETDIDAVLNDIREHAQVVASSGTSKRSNKIETQEDTYFYFVVPLLILLLIEMIDVLKKRHK